MSLNGQQHFLEERTFFDIQGNSGTNRIVMRAFYLGLFQMGDSLSELILSCRHAPIFSYPTRASGIIVLSKRATKYRELVPSFS